MRAGESKYETVYEECIRLAESVRRGLGNPQLMERDYEGIAALLAQAARRAWRE